MFIPAPYESDFNVALQNLSQNEEQAKSESFDNSQYVNPEYIFNIKVAINSDYV